MNRTVTLLVVAAIAIGVFLVRNAVTLGRVDACLDSGGSFDYANRVCDREVTHPGP